MHDQPSNPTPPALPDFDPNGPSTLTGLTPNQHTAWAVQQIEPRSISCVLGSAFRYTGPLDVESMTRTLRMIHRRHEALHTVMRVVDGTPVPGLDPEPLAVPLVDLSDRAPAEREAEMAEIRRVEGARPFHFDGSPLMRCRIVRLEPEVHEVVYTFHHIIVDGWTRGLMAFDCAMIYGALISGQKPWIAEPVAYSRFAAWQAEALQGETLERLRDHWRRQLDGVRPLALPIDRARSQRADFAVETIDRALPAETYARLMTLSKAEGVSRFDLLHTACTLALGQVTGADDVVTMVPFAHRFQPTMRPVVGYLANPLPLRSTFDRDEPVMAVVRRTRSAKSAAKAWQALPFGEVQGLVDNALDALSRVSFDLMDVRRDIPMPGLEVDWVRLPSSYAAGFELLVSCLEWKDRIDVSWVYASALYDASTVNRLLDTYIAVLDALVTAPDHTVAEVLAAARRALEPRSGVDTDAVRRAILALDGIEECHVLERDADLGSTLTVHYSATRSIPDARLRRQLAGLPEGQTRLVSFAAVTAMPRGADGRVDEAALATLPVIDALAEARWQAAIDGLAGPGTVVVERRPHARPPALHLDDIAPEVAAPSAAASRSPAIGFADEADGPLALADGGPLTVPADAPKTFTEALRRAAERGEGGLVFVDLDGTEHRQSYAELYDAARRVWTGLRAAGVEPGGAAILQIADARAYYPVFWGCVLGGITPVTVAIPPTYTADNPVVSKLFNTWNLLERPPILATGMLAEPLRAVGAERGHGPVKVVPIEGLADAPPAEPIVEATPDDLMFFQLTSGSTGTPKCIRETHGGIIRHIHGSQQECDYRGDDVCLNWLARDHVVPILTFHLKGVYLGCTQVEVPIQTVLGDPLRWLDLMDRHRVTHSWAPNFGFKNVVNALADVDGRAWDLASVKYLMNAGEQVTRPVIGEFMRLLAPFGLRSTAMQPAFGMAEVCTCMTYENDFDLERSAPLVRKASLDGRLEDTTPDDPDGISFVLLGPPMPGVAIRITDAQNQVLPERVIGRLQIKGGVVTPGYLNNPDANAEAFVGDGWFNTGDLGFIRDGRLAITGREKEMIVLHGANHYCYELEHVVERLDGVASSFVAACGVPDPATGTEGLAIFYSPQDPRRPLVDAALIGRIEAALAEGIGLRPSHVIPIEQARFPKTTSGKIQRSGLKKRLMAGGFADLQKQLDIALENERTVPDWFYTERLRPHAIDAAQRAKAQVLVLGPGADALAAALRGGGHPAHALVDVEPGELAAIFESHLEQPFDEIIDLRPLVDAPAAAWSAPTGPLAVLDVLRAAARHRPPDHRLTLRVLTRGTPDEAHGGPTAGLLFGLLGSAARENPWLATSLVDVAGASPERAIDLALAELAAPIPPNRTVRAAWRGGRRLTPGLERITPVPPAAPPIEDGAVYVVSGGLGDLAMAVAEDLLRRHRVKLLLLGRTPLAERTGGRFAMRRLGRLGGEVHYRAVDVTDAEAVDRAMDEAATLFGRAPAGVFHLAGVYTSRPVLEETAATLRETMAVKIDGALNLARHVDRPGALFVAFSSVLAVRPGSTTGAYSAANGALDGVVAELRRQGRRAISLAWTTWTGLGMSRTVAALDDLAEYAGFQLIGKAQGVAAMRVALGQDAPNVIIGLDPASPATAACAGGAAARPAERLVARPVGEVDDPVAAAIDGLQTLDRFGVAVGGTLDRFGESGGPGQGAAFVAPETETEKRIADIWCTVLGLDRVGIDDDLFRIGGTSLAAARIFDQLQTLAGRALSVAELFRFRTIRQLSSHLEP